jgi:hypothetical protein
MDSQRLHLRSTVIVDQALLDRLPPISPEFEHEATGEARIVANTLVISGGTVRGYHLKLIGESIFASDASATVTVGLVNRTTPPFFPIRVGHPLTVVAARLNGARGISVGQGGRKGPKGRDGIEMPPIPQPDPQPGDPVPPLQLGRNGEKGGTGTDGGDGGPVTLILRQASAITSDWFGKGGAPGEGGDGGAPEDFPPHLGIDGEPGDPGDPGTPGDDKPATVHVVDLEGFREGVARALVLGDWARFRQALAVEEFQRGNFAVALAERDAAIELDGVPQNLPPSMADALPALVRDQRNITGVARDQDLVPDIEHHAREYTKAADALRAKIAVFTDFFGSLILLAEPRDRLAAIKQALVQLAGVSAGEPGQQPQLGELQLVGGDDLAKRAKAALTAINDLRKRTTSALGRIDELLADPQVSASITPAGQGQPTLQAKDVATALAQVLGAQDAAAAPTPAETTVLIPEPAGGPPFRPELDPVTLLPADLHLLVHRSVRERRLVTPDDAALIAERAAGLAQIARWKDVAANQTGADGVPAAVHLGRVAQDLRAASGDRGVLDALIELAEISHVWRLGRARMEQLLAGVKTLAHREVVAKAARDAFVPPEPLPVEPTRLLPGLRCLLDALSWHAERADRAADLLTFGLTRQKSTELTRFPLRPDTTGEARRLAPLMYAPDWECELSDRFRADFQPGDGEPAIDERLFFDSIALGLMFRKPLELYDAYLDRGIPLGSKEPQSVTRAFKRTPDVASPLPADVRPDVFDRFEDKGNLWFDVTLGEIAGPAGTIPHKETRVVGLKITLEFDAETPTEQLTLLATHTGLSVQRDLDDNEHRQQMLPAAVEVTLTVPADDGTPALQLLQGTAMVDPAKKIDFAAYGRGAAAGWLIAKADPTIELPGLQTIIVEVFYEGIVPKNTVSLRSVSSAPAALRVGSELPVTVRLTAPAGAGGTPVFLSSSDPSVITTPGAIAVPQGQIEARGLVKVVGPTGGLPPTISARTADGVTRRVRPIVPKPPRPVTASVRLAPSGVAGHVNAVAILPGASGQPGQVLATFSRPLDPGGTATSPDLLHLRGGDLGPVHQVEVARGARSLAFDAARGRIHVLSGDGQNIVIAALDAKTFKPAAEHRALGFGMIDVEVDSAGGIVYASRFNPGRIMALAADDLRVVAELTDADPRLRRSLGIAVAPGTGGETFLYAARLVRGVENEEAAVTQIRRAADGSHTVAQSIRFADVGTQPVDVAVDPVHNLVFVACLGGVGIPPELIVLEHPTMTERGRVRLLSTGRAVAARPGRGLAYVVGEAGLMIIDARTLTLASRIPLDAGMPLAIAVDPVTGTAYVGHRDNATLMRIDAPTIGTPAFW